MIVEVLWTIAAVPGRADEVERALNESPATVDVTRLDETTMNWRARFASPLPDGADAQHAFAQGHGYLHAFIAEPPAGVAWIDGVNLQYIDDAPEAARA